MQLTNGYLDQQYEIHAPPHIVHAKFDVQVQIFSMPCWDIRCRLQTFQKLITHKGIRLNYSAASTNACYRFGIERSFFFVRSLQKPPAHVHRLHEMPINKHKQLKHIFNMGLNEFYKYAFDWTTWIVALEFSLIRIPCTMKWFSATICTITICPPSPPLPPSA